LLVERKVLDVDDARALVDGDGNPENLSVVVDDDVRLIRYLVLAVRATVNNQRQPIVFITRSPAVARRADRTGCR